MLRSSGIDRRLEPEAGYNTDPHQGTNANTDEVTIASPAAGVSREAQISLAESRLACEEANAAASPKALDQLTLEKCVPAHGSPHANDSKETVCDQVSIMDGNAVL